jgi:ATP:ADP antiporter, AAA family
MSRSGGGLDRVLKLVGDVRPGEAVSAVLLTANVFLLLAAYYVLKPVREALILAGEGAEVKAYISAGQAVLLVALVPLYGALADRLPRRRLLNVVTAFFVVCLVGFYAFGRSGAPIAIPFFLWIGIFNLMIVAQFWSFANDIYSREQGERLFPIVGVGMSLGSVVGSLLTNRLIPLTGLYLPLLLAAVLLGIATLLTKRVDARERKRNEAGIPDRFSSAKLPAATGEYQVQGVGDATKVTLSFTGVVDRRSGFALVFSDRYLLAIALMILMLNWVNSTGEFILGKLIKGAAEAAVASGAAGGLTRGEYIGEFYSKFYLVVNLLGLALQLFAVSRLLKWFGVRVAILVLPLIALTGYAFLAFFPILSVVRWVKTGENATDYSLQNTLRNVLFLPTTRQQKYKAKQAIDGFFVRSGDVLSAGLVVVGTALGFALTDFARVNFVFALCWVVLAVVVGRAYMRKTAGQPV